MYFNIYYSSISLQSPHGKYIFPLYFFPEPFCIPFSTSLTSLTSPPQLPLKAVKGNLKRIDWLLPSACPSQKTCKDQKEISLEEQSQCWEYGCFSLTSSLLPLPHQSLRLPKSFQSRSLVCLSLLLSLLTSLPTLISTPFLPSPSI